MDVSIAYPVLKAIISFAAETVKQLLRLDGNVDIPDIGAWGRELVRFLQMAAACRLEETVGC